MVLAKYEIHWLDRNVIQRKNLIKHEDYTNIIKPIRSEIYDLELNKPKDYKNTVKSLKKKIDIFGEIWFTNESPIFAAMETGVMICNGNWNVKFKLLEENETNI